LAGKRDAEAVVAHAPATAEGIIDVALQLNHVGIGDPSLAGELITMRDSLQRREYGEAENKLFDTIFALVDGERAHVWGEDEKPKERGLITAALALAGVPEAKELAEARKREVESRDLGTFTTRVYGYGAEGRGPVAMPGDAVPEDVLEKVKDAHIVAVHTTGTNPLLGKVIRPTAEFNVGDKGQFPRDSVHFSLNHTVVNNVRIGEDGNIAMNDFTSRPYTIIAPYEGLLEANGAPLSQADVDTYFVAGPGNGVMLPSTALVLEVGAPTSTTEPLAINGNNITFNPSLLTTEAGLMNFGATLKEWTNTADIARLSAFPGAAYMKEAREERMSPEELARDCLIEKLESVIDFSLFEDIGTALQGLEGLDTFKSLKDEYVHKAKTVSAGVRPERELTLAFVDAFPALMAEPRIQPILTEKLRVLLANSAIANLGAKPVVGGYHYTQPEFQNVVNDIATEIGVTTALHSNTNESMFESSYWEALMRATDVERVVDSSGNATKLQKFDWTRYDTRSLWGNLSQSPRQVRRRALEMGILTFTDMPKRANQYDDDGKI